MKNNIKLIFSKLKLPHIKKKQLKQTSKNFHTKITSTKHKYIFTNLFYKKNNPSNNKFSPNIKNSNFPILSIYNISHSNLQTIPKSFSK